MLEPAIVRPPQFRIAGRNHEQVRTGLHARKQLRHQSKIILHVLEHIEKEHGIRACKDVLAILRSVSVPEFNAGKTLPCKRDGIKGRVYSNARIQRLERNSIASRPAPDIEDETIF